MKQLIQKDTPESVAEFVIDFVELAISEGKVASLIFEFRKKNRLNKLEAAVYKGLLDAVTDGCLHTEE